MTYSVHETMTALLWKSEQTLWSNIAKLPGFCCLMLRISAGDMPSNTSSGVEGRVQNWDQNAIFKSKRHRHTQQFSSHVDVLLFVNRYIIRGEGRVC
jgi:hypothetical protein